MSGFLWLKIEIEVCGLKEAEVESNNGNGEVIMEYLTSNQNIPKNNDEAALAHIHNFSSFYFLSLKASKPTIHNGPSPSLHTPSCLPPFQLYLCFI